MHDKGYVHRDLKPENVLLEKKGDPSNLKLIDFGTALLFSRDKGVVKLYDKKGTINYIAPEILRSKKDADESEGLYYNEKCDMWSIGIMAYFMVTGINPFGQEQDQNRMMKNIKNFARDSQGKIDPNYHQTHKIFTDDSFTCLHPDCQEFVKGLLNVDFKNSAKDGGRFSA